MDKLVERLHTLARGDHGRGCQGREYRCDCGYDAEAWEAADEAAARITALEASLAEAEGRVIAEVVAWLRRQADAGDTALLQAMEGSQLRRDIAAGVVAINRAATALETGRWKK